MNIEPVNLTGGAVQLVPLQMAHLAELTRAGSDPSIWQFMRYGIIDSESKMSALITNLLELQSRGTDLPFTVILRGDRRAIGMTRYLDIQQQHRSVEIGGTWYEVEYQRTPVNTECKLLLLQHAFERLGCIRVQFKTDLRNVRSQRAIERLGAVREGVLRDHMILPDGTVRSSVYYSVLAREWPEVKARLVAKLQIG